MAVSRYSKMIAARQRAVQRDKGDLTGELQAVLDKLEPADKLQALQDAMRAAGWNAKQAVNAMVSLRRDR